jgi:metal-responsive CopG/Arc/MetJ family transcriptional regulator
MSRDTTVKVSKELVERVDSVLGFRGFRTRRQFFEKAAEELLEKLSRSRRKQS